MDPITHLAIAYSLIFWVRKIHPIKQKLIPFILLGSVLPDIDMLFSWIPYFVPKLYWIEHQAITHSLLGVIPFVITAVALTEIPAIKKILSGKNDVPHKKNFTFGAIIGCYFGVLTHLGADFVVPTGLMLFFPITTKWYGLKILSSVNIHSLAAFAFISTLIPLRWSAKQQKMLLGFFIIILSLYASVRITSNVRAIALFKQTYGEGQSSSTEFLFTHNVNYKIVEGRPGNKTVIITIIDGIKQDFIERQIIPEYQIISSEPYNETFLETAFEKTLNSEHLKRFKQKNNIICSKAMKQEDGWEIQWFAPIRMAEQKIILGFYTYTSFHGLIYRVSPEGTISLIDHPISV